MTVLLVTKLMFLLIVTGLLLLVKAAVIKPTMYYKEEIEGIRKPDCLFILLDINECDEDSDGCAHQCTNTISSYYCSCNIGYSLDTDDHGCTSESIIIMYMFI